MNTSLLQTTRLSPKLQVYQNIVITFFVWLLLEGIFRKWILPSGATALFFVKYVIWGLANIYFILNNGESTTRQVPFLRMLLLYLIWGIFCFVIAGISYNFLVSILGFLIHFWFITMIFLLPLLLTSREKIMRVVRIFTYISIITSIVGIIQYFSPVDSYINRYALNEEELVNITAIGDNVRIISIFSYIGVYTAFVNIAVLVAFVRILDIRKINREATISVLALGLCILNSFMTGSRGLTFGATLEMIIIALVLTFTSSSANRFVLYILRFVLMAGLGFWLITQTGIGVKSFETFLVRVEESGDAESRLQDIFTPFKFLKDAGVAGYGLGTTYQGSATLVSDWGNMPRGFEEESERIILEMGLIGYLIVIGVRLSIILYAIKVYRMQTDRFLKTLALMITVYLSPELIGLGSLLFNWMENVFYWSLIGILVSLHRLSLRQQEQEEQYRIFKIQEAQRRQAALSR